MISDKNRFKTTEKLWNLDDKQLTSPEHDAMVLWLMERENAKTLLKPLSDYKSTSGFIDSDELDICDVDIRSEIPFQARNGFINAYGDLEIHLHETVKEKYYECQVSTETLELIKNAETVGDLMQILKQKYLITDFKPCLKDDYYSKYDKESFKEWRYSPNYYGVRDVLQLKLVDFFHNFTGYPKTMNNSDLEYWINNNNYYKFLRKDIRCLIEVKPFIESFGQVLRQINSYKVFWNPRGYGTLSVCLFTLDTQFDSQFESQGIKVLHPPEDFNLDEVMEHYGLK